MVSIGLSKHAFLQAEDSNALDVFLLGSYTYKHVVCSLYANIAGLQAYCMMDLGGTTDPLYLQTDCSWKTSDKTGKNHKS